VEWQPSSKTAPREELTAYAIIRLFPTDAAAITGGRILFGDVDLVSLPAEELNRYRGAPIAIVFQEPSSALNLTLSVGQQVIEGIVCTTANGAPASGPWNTPTGRARPLVLWTLPAPALRISNQSSARPKY